MAAGCFLIATHTNPFSPTLSPPQSLWTHQHPKPVYLKPQSLPNSPPVNFPVPGESWRVRGLSVVTLAGPNTNTYVLAFAVPVSLIVLTVFTALRIGDKLDQQYLEEVRLSEAIREANEDDDEDENDDDDDDVELPLEQGVTPSTRNRPIREI